MANIYYKYTQRNEAAGEFSDEREVILTSVEGDKIELSVTFRDESRNSRVNITLTEQEQDDLIAGILERRGVDTARIKAYIKFSVEELKVPSISSDGQEQSKLHPANK